MIHRNLAMPAWPWAVLFLGWLALVAVCKHSAVSTVEVTPAGKRSPFSETRFPLRPTGEWKLSQHHGEIVVVNLWAPWCPPCQREMPALVRTANRFKGQKLSVLGIVFDPGSDAAVDRFVERYEVNYPIANGTTSPVLQVSLPTTLIYDRNGRLAARTTGAIDEDSLVEALQSLLSESI